MLYKNANMGLPLRDVNKCPSSSPKTFPRYWSFHDASGTTLYARRQVCTAVVPRKKRAHRHVVGIIKLL